MCVIHNKPLFRYDNNILGMLIRDWKTKRSNIMQKDSILETSSLLLCSSEDFVLLLRITFSGKAQSYFIINLFRMYINTSSF